MVLRSVSGLLNSDQPSPWKIAFRVVLLMVTLLAAVWLVKDNPLVADQDTQVENKGKEASSERPS